MDCDEFKKFSDWLGMHDYMDYASGSADTQTGKPPLKPNWTQFRAQSPNLTL